MICLFKPCHPRMAKATPVEPPLPQPDRQVRADSIAWSPLTAGPYIVPVTRWVE
jgi:hypothetical protein